MQFFSTCMAIDRIGLRNIFIYMLTHNILRQSVDESCMTCPVCNHPKKEDIEEGLTMGVEFIKLAKMYDVTPEQLTEHWQHGMEGDVEKVDDKVFTGSNDMFTTLKYKLRHLKKRFGKLLLSEPATGQSKELIQLSKAIDDTISVTLKVQKELGISDETRIQELEKMMSEIIMVMPRLCKNDQAIMEKALGLETVVTDG